MMGERKVERRYTQEVAAPAEDSGEIELAAPTNRAMGRAAANLQLERQISTYPGETLAPRISQFTHPTIMGIAKHHGGHLTDRETHELFAALASHEIVTPLQNGLFLVKHKPPYRPAEDREPNSFKVRSPRDVQRAIAGINHLPEVQAARLLAKNLANPRRRGRHHKKRGWPCAGEKPW